MITSPTNTRMKEVRLLRQAKYRRARGEYFIEGIKLMEEALRHSEPVRQVVYSPQLEKVKRGVELLSLVRKNLPQVEWVYISDAVMESIADTQNHQGILAVLKKKEQSWAELWKREGIILLLHELQDPGNLGTILRTADAGGAAGAVLSAGTADPYNPKAVRATMGSIFRLPFLTEQDISECLRILRSRNFRVWAATPQGRQSLWEADFSRPAAVLLGQEGGGLPESLIALCDGSLTIPMKSGMDSLNVAMAAGLIVYEALRQKSRAEFGAQSNGRRGEIRR